MMSSSIKFVWISKQIFKVEPEAQAKVTAPASAKYPGSGSETLPKTWQNSMKFERITAQIHTIQLEEEVGG